MDSIIPPLIQAGDARIIIEMPPRHGKSQYASHYLPSWFLLKYADRHVIHASYEAGFSRSWGRRVRDTIAEHGSQYGVTVRRDVTSVSDWLTDQGGGMVTTGVGGPMTGRGAHLLIIDDPIKNRDEAESVTYRERALEWFRSTAYTRLEPGGSVILIMTRWHQADLVGSLRAEPEDDEETNENWRIISLPAIAEKADEIGRNAGEALWPDRYNLNRLERIRARIGSYWFSALYQQRPVPREGALWRHQWIEDHRVSYEDVPPLERVIVAVDPAGSTKQHSDSTGISVAGISADRHLYVFSSRGYQESPYNWGSIALTLYEGWRADKLIGEGNYGGDMVESTIRQVAREQMKEVNFQLVKASRGKVLRAEPIAALYESGRVHHVGRLQELEDQLTTFPISNEHDDCLDSAVWALLELIGSTADYDDSGFVGGL